MSKHKFAYSVSFGSWYARTQLHLSEVFEFLSDGTSLLELDSDILRQLQARLEIKSISRVIEPLEFIQVKTKNDIEIKYFEDGLYTLTHISNDVNKSKAILRDYYKSRFSPALSYLFSLGAPTPKILAKMTEQHPFAIHLLSENSVQAIDDSDLMHFIQNAYSQIHLKDGSISLFADRSQILLIAHKSDLTVISDLLEMQIFFREFKNQLSHYLNTHRVLWEKVANLKEKKKLSTSELEKIRLELEDDQKIVSLISSRINQMKSYISTRSALADQLKINDYLKELFQYRFDTLSSSHEYVKELWKMTENYINSAISLSNQIENRSVSHNLKTVAFITSLGTFSFISTLFAKTELPKITPTGLVYVVMMFSFAICVNGFAYIFFKHLKYSLSKK